MEKRQRAILTTLAVLVSLSGLAYLIQSTQVRAATSITVTTTADLLADDGLCSLREAILAANSDSAVGGCPAGSGTDTILIDASLGSPATFILTRNAANEDASQSGDLDIAGNLTITPALASQNSAFIIDGNGSDRVLHILANANLTIHGATIQQGNPGSGADGGGVLVERLGRLNISQSQVIENSADKGGGIMVKGTLSLDHTLVDNNSGGGLHNDAGLLLLTHVTVTNNSGDYGIRNQNIAGMTLTSGRVENNQGGIYNATSTATLSDTLITGNQQGGGVVNTGNVLTRLTINRSQILSNTATSGGGISNSGTGATAIINDSWLAYNQAIGATGVAGSGGAIFNNGTLTVNRSTFDHNQAFSGGGIRHFGGNLTLNNVTISSNTVSNNGGGIYNGAAAILEQVTVANNAAGGGDSGDNIFNDEGSLALRNSIVANPIGGNNCFNSGGFLNSSGHNLESADECNLHGVGDLINSDAKLALLQDNGGPAPTHALLTGSPALDAGDAAKCLKTDERGIKRPQGDGCDIGAYEFVVTVVTTPTATATATSSATTVVATHTATPTVSPTVSPTATPSSSGTPQPPTTTPTATSAVATATASETPTATMTSITATATATPTATPSVATATPVPTKTELPAFRNFLPLIARG